MALSLSVCPSVRPSQADVVSAEWIELVIGTQPTLGLSYTVLEGDSGIFKNNGTSIWNFVPNSGLRKISQLHVDRRRCCQVNLDGRSA